MKNNKLSDYFTKPLPPKWYSKAERFIWFNWPWIAIIAAFVFVFVFPVIHVERIDYPDR